MNNIPQDPLDALCRGLRRSDWQPMPDAGVVVSTMRRKQRRRLYRRCAGVAAAVGVVSIVGGALISWPERGGLEPSKIAKDQRQQPNVLETRPTYPVRESASPQITIDLPRVVQGNGIVNEYFVDLGHIGGTPSKSGSDQLSVGIAPEQAIVGGLHVEDRPEFGPRGKYRPLVRATDSCALDVWLRWAPESVCATGGPRTSMHDIPQQESLVLTGTSDKGVYLDSRDRVVAVVTASVAILIPSTSAAPEHELATPFVYVEPNSFASRTPAFGFYSSKDATAEAESDSATVLSTGVMATVVPAPSAIWVIAAWTILPPKLAGRRRR